MKNQKMSNIICKIKKSCILQLVICILLSTSVLGCFFILNKIIDITKNKKYTIVEDMNFINSIENVRIENDTIMITGYAFLLGKHNYDNVISIFLRNIDTQKEIWLDIEQFNRPDVNTYFNGGYNYENSGFIASKDTGKLSNDDVYDIVINIDYIEAENTLEEKKYRKTVSTKQYLLNNKLYAYIPSEYDALDIDTESILLKEVISNGQLCFYEMEAGMFVYQYNKKLYWITTKDFKFSESASTYIPYQLYTSQVDKLPEQRIKYKYDNLDFIFEQYEYMEELTAPYRVAIRDIPEEYTITYIKTGLYDKENNEWILTKNFLLNNLIKAE